MKNFRFRDGWIRDGEIGGRQTRDRGCKKNGNFSLFKPNIINLQDHSAT